MNTIAAQLRSAKSRATAGGFSVDKKLQAKRALLTSIGGDLSEIEGSSAIQTNYLLWLSRSFISRPVAFSAAAIVLTTSGLLTTVSAAQQSLPGEMLYSVKLINERAQLHIASLDRRAVLHTEFAENRLHEVEMLQADSSTRNSSLVTETVKAYTQEVASANQNLRALQASGDATILATANTVDQNLSSLDSAMQRAVTPVTSEDGSAAVSDAVTTTQVAQEDTITVAVQAQDENEQVSSAPSSRELDDMFDRQYSAITTREAFDLRRLSTIRSLLENHADILADVSPLSVSDLSRLERSIKTATSDLNSIMNAFAAGGYRSAFDSLNHIDSVLRGIESAIAEAETVITETMMNAPVTDQSVTP